MDCKRDKYYSEVLVCDRFASLYQQETQEKMKVISMAQDLGKHLSMSEEM